MATVSVKALSEQVLSPSNKCKDFCLDCLNALVYTGKSQSNLLLCNQKNLVAKMLSSVLSCTRQFYITDPTIHLYNDIQQIFIECPLYVRHNSGSV